MKMALRIIASLGIGLACAIPGALISLAITRFLSVYGWMVFFWVELGAAIFGIAGFAFSLRSLIKHSPAK
jgi:hypothetical protein